MRLQRPRDPEKRAHEREIADYSNDYEVVIIHTPTEGGDETVLGKLNETFSNDVDASYAAADASIPDVNIRAEARIITGDETEPGEVIHVAEE